MSFQFISLDVSSRKSWHLPKWKLSLPFQIGIFVISFPFPIALANTPREIVSGGYVSKLSYLSPESNESDSVFNTEHHPGFSLIFKTGQYQNSLKQFIFVY